LISGAPKSTKLVDLVKEEDWEVHLESILIKSNRIHFPLLSKIMFHQFPCGLTTQESAVDQIADFFTLTGMHEAVDAAVPCCAAQGAGCENAKFPFVGKLEPQPNSSWRITSAAKELLPLLRGANAM